MAGKDTSGTKDNTNAVPAHASIGAEADRSIGARELGLGCVFHSSTTTQRKVTGIINHAEAKVGDAPRLIDSAVGSIHSSMPSAQPNEFRTVSNSIRNTGSITNAMARPTTAQMDPCPELRSVNASTRVNGTLQDKRSTGPGRAPITPPIPRSVFEEKTNATMNRIKISDSTSILKGDLGISPT